MKKNKILRALISPKYLAQGLLKKIAPIIKDDKLYLSLRYRILFGRNINWNDPQTYTEKLQWLKLYYRDPIMTTMVDKYAAKEYVAKLIGKEHIIPTLGVWNSFDEIDFSQLPNQFVLKNTHDSGGIFICTDKSKINYDEAKKCFKNSSKKSYYSTSREWPYLNVPKRIIAEEYMVDESGYELKDYKWFCFDGEPKALFIASDRQVKGEETKFDFFDMDFNHLDIRNGHPNAKHSINKPVGFDEMKKLASMLSKGYPHLRVDFYDINGRIYFGELTFYHWSGFTGFEPSNWDLIFGEWIKLPLKKYE